MTVNAMLVVCDDVRIEFNGKAIFIGVYTDDISIPVPNFQAHQLVFFFFLNGPIGRRPRSLAFEVTLPSGTPFHWDVTLPAQGPELLPGRTHWTFRQVFPISQPMLNAGKIDATIILDGEKMTIGAPWIVLSPASGALSGN